MIRAVIDTNCLLASVPPQSAYFKFYRLFETEALGWVVSNEILTEYEKLADNYSTHTADLVLTILIVAPNVLFRKLITLGN